MPAGNNLGGNLNVFLFEVGFIDTTDEVGEGSPFVVGVHPLVIVPESITYTDNSRSPVVQTGGGAIKTTSGRALRRVAFQGSFGVESSGLGIYLGTGETRFQRFYKEVVRLSDALSRDDTKAVVDILRGTPTLPLSLIRYDPDRHVPFVNFYDFWNDRKFSCTMSSWQDSRHHKRGGATGLVHYSMSIEEEGEVIVAGLGSKILQILFAGLQIWSGINDALKSYAIGAIFESLGNLGGIFVTQFDETLDALNSFLDPATRIAGGFTPSSATTGSGPADVSAETSEALLNPLARYFSTAESLADQADFLIQTAAAITPVTIDEETGAVDWANQVGEGGNAALDGSEQIDEMEDVADAARWQLAAGVLFGWSREEYQAFLTGQSEGGRGNDFSGSLRYVVRAVDTEALIEDRFGVAWDRILEANNLTPDEALFEGTVLQIPTVRARGSQNTIDGLPTFDSHVGESAWGIDLTTALDVDAGRLVTLSGPEVLVQGVNWLIEVFGEELIPLMDQVPALLRSRLIQQKLERQLLESDPRIVGIDAINIELEAATAIARIEVTLSALNGAEIQTGSVS